MILKLVSSKPYVSQSGKTGCRCCFVPATGNSIIGYDCFVNDDLCPSSLLILGQTYDLYLNDKGFAVYIDPKGV